MPTKSVRRRRVRVIGSPVASVSEPLERRMLLSLSAAGAEFLVNSATPGDQRSSAVAVDGDGDFVVAWSSSTGDGSGSAVFGRRFNSIGSALGSGFLVNTTTTFSQGSPAAATDAVGNFVITWGSLDGDDGGIFAQRYNSTGVAQGSEFRINTFTTGNQASSSVAMDAAGDFVVAWTSYGQDGSYYGVYARRYNSAGVAQEAAEFRANSFTTNSQSSPKVAMSAAGDFIVAWTGYTSAASGYDTYARRYNAAGTAQGTEFRVNNYTTNSQGFPSVAMGTTGDFVVAWDSSNQDGSSFGVYGRRYNAAGVAQGAEFKVNTYTTSSQRIPSTAMDADGDFVVTWTSLQDGDGYGIYAQVYNASGVAEGPEFKVNTYTTSKQFAPSVAIASTGDVVVAWESNLQDGSSYGIYAQRYTALPTVDVLINGSRVSPYQVNEASVSEIVVRFSKNVTDSGGTGGTNSVTNPANWRITRDGIDITGTTTITYGFNFAANRYEAVLHLPASYSSGNFLLIAKDNIRDISGNPLDGNFDGVAGGNYSVPFSIIGFGARGPEFRVNTYTTNEQYPPAVAMDQDGNFVVAWASYTQDGSFWGVYAQRYNAAGAAQGAEFRVNTYTTFDQRSPSVAMDPAGDFVVAWQSRGQDSDGDGIYAQRYNAVGAAQGTEFKVNTYTTSNQSFSSIAMDSAGNFVVAWESYGQDGAGPGLGVYARRYNAAGSAQGTEFKVNTYTANHQRFPKVGMDSAGDFVVAWSSSSQDGGGYGVYAQRYDAVGTAQGVEFKVNTYTTNHQSNPAVGMDSAGNFVVAWMSLGQADTAPDIYAQRYNAAGTAQGVEFKVNPYTTHNQTTPAVAMGPAGEFVVAWPSLNQDGSSYGIYAQRYTAAGVAQDAEFKVNTYTTDNQRYPALAMDSSGDFIVAWSSDFQDSSEYGVYAQRYGIRLAPLVSVLQDTPDPVISGNSFSLGASGVSSTDGILASVSFYRESNGVAGLQVGVFGDTLVGTDTTADAGVWSINISTSGLTPGIYTYWAQATDDAGLIGAPTSTTNTVSPLPAPLVTASSFLYQTAPQKLTFTFDRNVSASLSLSDVGITRIGGGAVPTFTLLPYGTDGTNVVSVTFNTSLGDGNFRATLLGSDPNNGISDPISGNRMASDYVLEFFILGGDANHDRKVDINDLYILASNFNGAGKTFSQADFNYDALVNAADLGILASHWQQSLMPPPPAATASLPIPRRSATRMISIMPV